MEISNHLSNADQVVLTFIAEMTPIECAQRFVTQAVIATEDMLETRKADAFQLKNVQVLKECYYYSRPN